MKIRKPIWRVFDIYKDGTGKVISSGIIKSFKKEKDAEKFAKEMQNITFHKMYIFREWNKMKKVV